MPLYAQVAFNRPLPPYSYAVPGALEVGLAEGALVKAPLGNSAEIGCVVGLGGDLPPGVAASGVKELAGLATPEFRIPAEILKLAQFVSRYYCCSLGEALSTASMVGFADVTTRGPAVYGLAPDFLERAAAANLTKRQAVIVETLDMLRPDPATRSALAKSAGSSPGVIGKLVEAGVLVEVTDAPLPGDGPGRGSLEVPHEFNAPQRAACDAVLAAMQAGTFGVFLLHGVTGSGKTEVYLQAMDAALARGRTALCLVPEIALTPQTVDRFERRFGPRIGVSHSQLTRREKLALYQRIASGQVRIVIGARSAVFCPLENLGLIVLDEEHDGSYKQGETPRYHARDIAAVRAQQLGVPLVLGSATPSLESMANAVNGKFTLYTLPERASGRELPPVRVIDLAREVRRGGEVRNISEPLESAIRQRLERGEQSILFLNRRGFSNFLFCPSCRWVARCEEDDVSMTVHRHGRPAARRAEPAAAELDLFENADSEAGNLPPEGFLKCHFCGARAPVPTTCPGCGKEDVMTVGAGTQRIEDELRTLFPGEDILRMDQDTVGRKGAYAELYEEMRSGRAKIILGTQMLAKGLHLDGVTLVGVILADVGLFVPDFRADERTFSLLTQVAGRSGRASAGEVLLQTYMPDHPAIRFATLHDYDGFFAAEMKRRRAIGFPPYTRLVSLTYSDTDRDRAFAAARSNASILWRLRQQARYSGVRVNGPNVAPISRLANRWRFRILLRGEERRPLLGLLHGMLDHREARLPSSVRLSIDVDPMDMM